MFLVDWTVKMRIRPPEFETSICDAKYHVSLSPKLLAAASPPLISLTAAARCTPPPPPPLRRNSFQPIRRGESVRADLVTPSSAGSRRPKYRRTSTARCRRTRRCHNERHCGRWTCAGHALVARVTAEACAPIAHRGRYVARLVAPQAMQPCANRCAVADRWERLFAPLLLGWSSAAACEEGDAGWTLSAQDVAHAGRRWAALVEAMHAAGCARCALAARRCARRRALPPRSLWWRRRRPAASPASLRRCRDGWSDFF
ncbi:hypothetical protein F511_18218 [Dorcoceras hygrometricum]|uniref:Uncharacterized protein n=1 Tax=Dorcoceras hygrometricum TaxID=472368 RepID=A0A2Z7BH26_9LAMI|nr:hypothetical protein F511_18218 [Dorcoceras hygrometricum]